MAPRRSGSGQNDDADKYIAQSFRRRNASTTPNEHFEPSIKALGMTWEG
jgi:hypothetical protein